MTVRLESGNCLEVMRRLAEEGVKVDAIVTDPPYHLTASANGGGFMGKAWDGGDVAFNSVTWGTAASLLKPGGWLLAFGGTRTYHKLGWAIEGGGFEIRDMVSWLYGSGFSKVGMLRNRQPEMFCDCPTSEHEMRSMRGSDLPEAVHTGDEQREVLQPGVSQQGPSEHGRSGAEPEVGGTEQPGMEGRSIRGTGEGLRDGPAARPSESEEERLRSGAHPSGRGNVGAASDGDRRSPPHQSGASGQPAGEPADIPGSQDALGSGAHRGRTSCPRCGKIPREFDGFGGSLKPACEPICVARKPLSESSVAANVLKHGTGALNVDGCRIETADEIKPVWGGRKGEKHGSKYGHSDDYMSNVSPLGRWPANVCHDGSPEVEEAFAAFGEQGGGYGKRGGGGSVYSEDASFRGDMREVGYGDTGTASRFFYTAKADKHDRWGSKHPTVKPIDLMRWLVRLVTPPGGIVLDPFAGSGTTGIAAMAEGFDCILIEREEEYLADIRERLAFYEGDGKHSLAAKHRKSEAGHDDLPLFGNKP